MTEKIDHDYTDELVCPECGHEQSDSWELSDENGRTDCGECGKEFEYVQHISISYSTEKIPPDECKKCNGSRTMIDWGADPCPEQVDCDGCNGTGKVTS